MRTPRTSAFAPLLCAALAAASALGCSKAEPAGNDPGGNKPAAGLTTTATAAATAGPKAGGGGALDPAAATERAPDTFKAKFTTTKGDFVVQVKREWSPNGADRFYNLVKMGFYNDTRFFRTIEGFMVQFGIHGDPTVTAKWKNARIPDDVQANKQSNKRGYVTFAKTGLPNSRTTQIFINYSDSNARLDASGFTPFGQVVEGMNVVDSLYKGYGEGAPQGQGPDQGRLQSEGNAYLDKEFPKLDGVKRAEIVP
ncbi:MAG TPA: peptidylprolyl isomerase [Polyangiaceae bacterium]|nr:peptidylprolyl isomerase [Polyangiaceae bacterium]